MRFRFCTNFRGLWSLIIGLLLFQGCNTDRVDQAEKSFPTFSLVPNDHSKVSFVNRLRESPTQNVLAYEYYYNGAGLAVGDVNGDRLPDLYFVSNIEPNALYLNKGDLVFEEVPMAGGAAGTRGFYTGVVFVDLNHDGRLDIYVCKSGRFDNPELRRNELYLNQGTDEKGIPQFVEAARSFGLDVPAYSTQASFFDYDRDGDLDLFLINHDIDTYPLTELSPRKEQQDGLTGVMLFQNEDDFFHEVTHEAGLENNRLGFGLGLAVGDLNNDHWPDVYVSHDYSGKDHLYINQGDGTFEEQVEKMTGHTSFYSMGNDIADFNNDGWQDIVNLDMVAADNYGVKTSMSAMNPAQFGQLLSEGQHRQYMYNTLLLNNSPIHPDSLPYFSNVARMSGLSSTDWSWAPLLFDFDNDGNKDLFITNGIKRNIRNNDAVKKVEEARKMLAQLSSPQEKARLIQQMLSTFPYHRKPNYFFHNEGNLSFQNMGKKWGTDSLSTASNGAVYADLDLDGDLELIINNVDQPAMILRNNSQEQAGGGYAQFEARGPSLNPQGIGMEVTIWVANTQQLAALYPSRGYMSSVEPILHFGVGESEQIDSLRVRWPDGKVQWMRDVSVNQRITLDYAQATSEHNQPTSVLATLFSSPDLFRDPSFLHEENPFDDFERESLLPHKMSQMGPALAAGDVNGDGLDDLFFGGAKGKPSRLWFQAENGSFSPDNNPLWQAEKRFEEVEAVLLDVDQDGDIDLIVGSGGNESVANGPAYQLRVYQNDGKGKFTRSAQTDLPVRESVGTIAPFDWDGDGDMDLFVGGRQIPGAYPLPANSYLLENVSQSGNIRFKDKTADLAPFLTEIGMVTDAVWSDMVGDSRPDLLLIGEWMAPRLIERRDSGFVEVSEEAGLASHVGWWYTAEVADMDGDGDLDFVAGNLGLNYKYQASPDHPFSIHASDFDQNGSLDPVLGYQEGKQNFPVRGRECSSNQMPFIKTRFPTYDAFGKATLKDIFGTENLDASVSYQATDFASTYFENQGDGTFTAHPLPRAAQVSSINAILIQDFDGDGVKDMLVGGNLYGSEVETPRNDASIGLFLKGVQNAKAPYICKPIAPEQSGVHLDGEIRDMISFRWKGTETILIGKNQQFLQLLTYRKGMNL